MSSYDPLNERGDFKLHGARIHLRNLKRLQAIAGTPNLSGFRLEAEIEIDEILYYLVGVKDALLQEINRRFSLGLELSEVKIETINERLKEKYGEIVAKDILIEIRRMTSSTEDPLWLINECHNHSKHREMLGMALTMVVGGPGGGGTNASLIDPRNGQGMRRDNGTQITPVEYLEESYRQIETLQKDVRDRLTITSLHYCLDRDFPT